MQAALILTRAMPGFLTSRIIATFLSTWALGACAPQLILPGPNITEPKLTDTVLVMPDGVNLPLHQWVPRRVPKAVILALHGFNDYGLFIEKAAAYFRMRGVHIYAYDQRGFGAAPHLGQWPGRKALADDLITVTTLLRKKHPGTPLYHLGASMGGAVLMIAATRDTQLRTDGLILAAPAVWGRISMSFYERWALSLMSHMMPWLTLSGKGLNIKPSDNIKMLRALRRDPLIIKETRVDAVWGLVNLMDDALASSSKLETRALILFGEKDEIIKQKPAFKMQRNLSKKSKSGHQVISYEQGYHMLLRDLQAEKVWRDIIYWIYKT